MAVLPLGINWSECILTCMKTLTSTLCILAVSLFAFVSTSAAADEKKEKKAKAATYSVGVTGVT